MHTRKYNVTLIGCGNIGSAHMDDIYNKNNITLQCVCDTNEERARAFYDKYHAECYETDWEKAVSSENTDIVIIATYPSSHLEILKECIKHGKHVICEKPITPDLRSGREFVRTVKENPQCKVLIGYILRHNKTYRKVAQMIQSGAIGKPIIMRMAQNHHTMNWERYLQLICETSPIIDCGIHYLDVMQWFTGSKITDISGIGLKTESDVPDGKYNYGLITTHMSDGSIAYYEAGWSNTMASDNLKEFVGPKGRIKITYQNLRHDNQEEGDLIEYYTYPQKHYEEINVLCKRKPMGDQLDVLIDMIENNSPGTPTIDDVWESFCWAIKADEIIKEKL